LIGQEIHGYFLHSKGKVGLDEIGSIWYRRPVTPVPSDDISNGPAKEFCITESKEFLEGVWKNLDCFWVSKPDSIRKAENKLYQLKVASQLGFLVPKTIITNNPDELSSFFEFCEGNIINKPLRRGRLRYEDGLKLIYTNRVTKDKIEQKSLVKYSPTFFQEYVPKELEIRITVVGDKVFPIAIHSQKNVLTVDDWRRDQKGDLKYSHHELPPNVEDKCRRLLKEFGLQFGAIDMILTPKRDYYFLEINPNGQWAWIEEVSSLPMAATLIDLLTNGWEK
jgi:glutathione synthase/RimK-type ligase-like ATP-grasp enzyme